MTVNGLEPVLDNNSQQGEWPSASIPDAPLPLCCCGNTDCPFLRQNNDTFEALEGSLRTAGALGQALLVRHEAYVAEAESEKARMAAEIGQLMVEKQQLREQNASATEEKRGLLDQLESLNNAVTESDTHISVLTATLQSTQSELLKLNNLASRTDSLERELEQYEREQASMQSALDRKTEDERSMTLRWRDAERKMLALEDQLEAIEREAKEERERHVEIVGRMERQRVVEQELGTAAGRLGGAAAAKAMARDNRGSAVISHFVKDILQDNANLQMGIVELRDMLTSSNDEVERLREQLANYFPPDQTNPDLDVPDSKRLSSLSQEMSRASAQELHVHHHYHAPSDSSSSRQSLTLRRPKKKRHGLGPAIFTPSSGMRTPRSSTSGISTTLVSPSSSAAAILSQTAVTVPNTKNATYRWSMQSAYTTDSSIASSPPSTINQAPSIFDRGFSDAGIDSSRPTTPDSEDLGSPLFHPQRYQSKRGSAGYFRNSPAVPLRYGNQDDPSAFDQPPQSHDLDEIDGNLHTADHDTILEEDEHDLLAVGDASTDDYHDEALRFNDDSGIIPTINKSNFYSGSHRRAASHESLISVHGMDIHTLSSRPSQLLTTHSHRSGGRPFAGTARSFSSQPVVSATMAHAARPALAPRTSGPSHTLLSGMALSKPTPSSRPAKKTGGWLFGRWGSTPTPAPAPVHMETQRVTAAVAVAAVSNSPLATADATTSKALSSVVATPAFKLRAPGINQSGPILGFGPEPQLPPQPIMTRLDEEALRQSLAEAE